MAYFNTLLMYLGFGGGLLLLGLGAIPRIQQLRKPLSAAWVTIVALVFLLSPSSGRWVLSLWSPSRVVQGLLVLDITPPIWWSIVAISAAFAGLLWTAVGEREPSLRQTGLLVALNMLVLWLTLASGSLVMMLVLWSLFDIIWFLGRSSNVSEGERIVWAVALNGGASILLWIVSLFLLGEGGSGLWWLMRPSSSSFILLLIAACMRIGLYPFQVVHVEDRGRSHALSLSGMLSPLLGIGLLYRLLLLPIDQPNLSWLVAWGSVSAFWLGLKALSHTDYQALLPASYGLLVLSVTGAVVTNDPASLIISAGVWAVCLAVLIGARRYHADEAIWSWPVIIAQLMLLGVPPSPFLKLYHGLFTSAPWGLRILSFAGLVAGALTIVREVPEKATGRVTPPYAHLWLPSAGGAVLLVLAMVLVGFQVNVPSVEPVPFGLWGVAVVSGCVIGFWGDEVKALGRRAHAVLELLDLGWLYASVWQGANHILGVLRIIAEVVEGSGSVLWSALILLLVLLVAGGQ